MAAAKCGDRPKTSVDESDELSKTHMQVIMDGGRRFNASSRRLYEVVIPFERCAQDV